MAFDRARTSLAQIEEKLRALFGLAGTIGATFEPSVSPVVITNDLRDPGVSSFRGRHWAWSSEPVLANPGAAGRAYGLQFPVAVIIRGVWVTGLNTTLGNARLRVMLLAPDDALVAAWGGGNRVAGAWVDNLQQASTTTPLLDRAAGANIAFPANPERQTALSWSSPVQYSWVPVSWHAPAGGVLMLQQETVLAAGDQVRWGAQGEIF